MTESEPLWEEIFGSSIDLASCVWQVFDKFSSGHQSQRCDLSLVEENDEPDEEDLDNSPRPSYASVESHSLAGMELPDEESNGEWPLCHQVHREGHHQEHHYEEIRTVFGHSNGTASDKTLLSYGLSSRTSTLDSNATLDESYDGSSTISQDTGRQSGFLSDDAVPDDCSGGEQSPKKMDMLDCVVREIVTSERTYVHDLRALIEGYLRYIRNSNSSSTAETRFPDEDIHALFGNIEHIYQFNSEFIIDLEQCNNDSVGIAQSFVDMSDYFVERYTLYCTNYPRCVAVLTKLMNKEDTAHFFKMRQAALGHGLPIGSYLLKPVQRILKYHLLLQNCVKYSDPRSAGHSTLECALATMTGIASHINEMKRRHEHAVRVQEIQSALQAWSGQDLTTYGELAREGRFRMHGAKNYRHLFLFDKVLIITKKQTDSYLYRGHVMCSNLMLVENLPKEPLCFHVVPFDRPKVQYTFQAQSLEVKREWTTDLKRLMLDSYNVVIPEKARELLMKLGQTRNHDGREIPKLSSAEAPKRQYLDYLERRKNFRRYKTDTALTSFFASFRVRKAGKRLMYDNTIQQSSHDEYKSELSSSEDEETGSFQRTVSQRKSLPASIMSRVTASPRVKRNKEPAPSEGSSPLLLHRRKSAPVRALFGQPPMDSLEDARTRSKHRSLTLSEGCSPNWHGSQASTDSSRVHSESALVRAQSKQFKSLEALLQRSRSVDGVDEAHDDLDWQDKMQPWLGQDCHRTEPHSIVDASSFATSVPNSPSKPMEHRESVTTLIRNAKHVVNQWTSKLSNPISRTRPKSIEPPPVNGKGVSEHPDEKKHRPLKHRLIPKFRRKSNTLPAKEPLVPKENGTHPLDLHPADVIEFWDMRKQGGEGIGARMAENRFALCDANALTLQRSSRKRADSALKGNGLAHPPSADDADSEYVTLASLLDPTEACESETSNPSTESASRAGDFYENQLSEALESSASDNFRDSAIYSDSECDFQHGHGPSTAAHEDEGNAIQTGHWMRRSIRETVRAIETYYNGQRRSDSSDRALRRRASEKSSMIQQRLRLGGELGAAAD